MAKTNYDVHVNPYWYGLSRFVVRSVASVVFRFRATGIENIPREGAVLAVANHQSHLDPPLIGAGSPRNMVYLARATLFDFRPFAALIRSYGAIPLRQDAPPVTGIRAALVQLKQKRMLLMFPEGSRTPDGEIHPFKPGFAALARKTSATILPIAIEGAYKAWPRTRPFPLPGRVHVHYGAPIAPDEYAAWSEDELTNVVEHKVREYWEMLRQRPEFRRRT
ncbi:hypothetical protein JCM19992_30020 [Thermostilla marina]